MSDRIPYKPPRLLDVDAPLKSCPFCGGPARLADARKCLVVSKYSYLFPYSVKCDNKHCMVKPYTEYCDTDAEAIAAWNRRADA